MSTRQHDRTITAWLGILGWLVLTTLSVLTPSASAELIKLQASVKVQEWQAVITNQDSFDWTNVTFEMLYYVSPSGDSDVTERDARIELMLQIATNPQYYALKIPRLASGQTYTADVRRFAKKDGTPFNPLTAEETPFGISCDTPSGRGFWSRARWRASSKDELADAKAELQELTKENEAIARATGEEKQRLIRQSQERTQARRDADERLRQEDQRNWVAGTFEFRAQPGE